MDRKERIMALLKAGVINKDDALMLLEQEVQNNSASAGKVKLEETDSFSHEELQEEVAKIVEKTNSLSAQIDGDKGQLVQLKEQLKHKTDYLESLQEAYADFQERRQEQGEAADGFTPTSVDELLQAEIGGDPVTVETPGQEPDPEQPFAHFSEKEFVEAIADSREDLDDLTKAIQEKEADISLLSQKLSDINSRVRSSRTASEEQEDEGKQETSEAGGEEKAKSVQSQKLFEGVEELNDLAKETAKWVNRVTPSILSAVKDYSDRVKELADDLAIEVDRKGNRDTEKSKEESLSFQEEVAIDDQASLVDIKLACGEVDVKVEAGEKERLMITYQTNGQLSLNEFRDEISKCRLAVIDQERVKFHFSSRKVRAHVTLYLADRSYDYVSLKVITGSVQAKGIKGQDFLTKVKTGRIAIDQVTGTMMESSNQTGKIYMKGCHFKDVVAKLTTGKIYYTGNVQGIDLAVNTGNILLDTDAHLQHAEAKVQTGNIRWYNMTYPAIEADLRARIGTISHPYEREDMDITVEENRRAGQRLKFRTLTETTPVVVNLATNLGNIQLTADREKVEE